MMFNWTSDVPPSIVLALERSHSRVKRSSSGGEPLAFPAKALKAFRLQQHLIAAFVQFSGLKLEHRRQRPGRRAGLGLLGGAAAGKLESVRIH